MIRYKHYRFLLFLASLTLLIGCQAQSILPSQDYIDIRNNVIRLQGETVRLGGRITAISRTNDSVKLEIMNVPLVFGQPDLTQKSLGRFVATTHLMNLSSKFNDYRLNGMLITVIGKIDGPTEVQNKIGMYPTFSLNIIQYTLFDLNELALAQGLMTNQANNLEALNARLASRIEELKYLNSFVEQLR